MTPMANPLVEGQGSGAPIAPGAPPASAGPVPAGGGRLAALSNFTSADNTSSHVGVIVALALGVVIILYLGGFHFAVDAGVTRR